MACFTESARIRPICVIRVLFPLPVVGEDVAGEFRLGAEVEQKPHFDLRGLEVVEKLRSVRWTQALGPRA